MFPPTTPTAPTKDKIFFYIIMRNILPTAPRPRALAITDVPTAAPPKINATPVATIGKLTKIKYMKYVYLCMYIKENDCKEY